jgi:UDP-N-acetyl-D-mannosaminuronate dehydrogenase
VSDSSIAVVSPPQVSSQLGHCTTAKVIKWSSYCRSPKMTDARDQHKLDVTSVPLNEASLRSLDAAVLVTDHWAFPYELVHRTVPLIVDTRNAFRSRGLQGAHVLSA